MMYVKVCDGGHKNVYEAENGAPLKCSVCGRNIVRAQEKLYVPDEIAEEKADKEPDEKKTQTSGTEGSSRKTFAITLESCNGAVTIPVSGELVIGRNSTGKEYLENFCDVSREHFTITPRASGISAVIKDCSSFGTYINGKEMKKGSSTIVIDGSEIRLASEAAFKLVVREVN
ncbi:MAG: FHA domain-containing protein [Clostridia bacterium]|nr:FHA domain-containing protein [Clostridia bacterium]MBR2418076.1 FHA domain-containing protein [Clostridia bacterium]